METVSIYSEENFKGAALKDSWFLSSQQGLSLEPSYSAIKSVGISTSNDRYILPLGNLLSDSLLTLLSNLWRSDSHSEKAKEKAKTLLEVCYLIFELFCLFFDLYRFR